MKLSYCDECTSMHVISRIYNVKIVLCMGIPLQLKTPPTKPQVCYISSWTFHLVTTLGQGCHNLVTVSIPTPRSSQCGDKVVITL